MGRYSTRLAPGFTAFAGVASGQRVVDVGCGPGALTGELVRLLGPEAVIAVDPSEPFVEAARERNPEVRVERASAEALPFPDASFDTALAQLVVHFMSDPIAGIGEMARVTHVGGTVAACVWDHAGDGGRSAPSGTPRTQSTPGPRTSRTFPARARATSAGSSRRPGCRRSRRRFSSATVEHPTFEEWWEPFELGVGPAGGYTSRLDPEHRAALREACRARLPPPPFALTVGAWAARGRRA